MEILWGFVAIASAYVLGSISFSIVIGKLVAGVDMRQHGSGNAGATNALRTLGKLPAILILILDIGKAVLAVGLSFLIVRQLDGDVTWIPALSSIAVIIGHNWPVFFGFRGGKGIAATIGAMLTLVWWPAFIAIVAGVMLMAITKYVSLGSLFMVALLPFLMTGFDQPLEYLLASIVVFALATFRHKGNIRNLLNGTERKIGSRKDIHHGGEQS